MDFRLTEQEQMSRHTARSFAEEEAAQIVPEMDRTNTFPEQLVQRMQKLGFFGLPYADDAGGSGGSYSILGIVVEELARASLSLAAIVSVHHLATEALYRFGNDQQRQRHLTPLVGGKEIGSFGFTEAETGTDPKQIKTVATPVNGGWQISGQKAFMSLAPAASKAIVFATDESERVSAFIVDTADRGFQVEPPLDTLGGRGLVTSPVFLNAVFVPEGDRLGEAGKGYQVLLDAISVGKLCVAHQAVGLAQAALDHSVSYAKLRTAYGRPIADLPMIQSKLADMASRTEAARWLAYRNMSMRDQNEPVLQASAEAKLFCSRTAMEVAEMAMEVHGSHGYVRGSAVERIFRDAKLTELYEGVPDIQRVILARGLLDA